MNRKLLPSLIAFAAIGAAHAADSIPVPTVYGKINVTLNKYNFDDIRNNTQVDGQDNWQLESNASRLGVKGDIPLVDGLKAVYKLEYEVFVDSDKLGDNGSDFKQRNTYGGLQGGWGTLIYGKNDTPLKAIAAETVQQFKDLPLGDFKYIMVGENRENNVVQYSSPNLSGFIFSLALMPGEDSGETLVSNGDKAENQNDGFADRFSTAVTYKLDTLYLGLGYDSNVQNTDTYRLVAQYGIGSVTIGGMYQSSERHDDDVVGTCSVPVANSTCNLKDNGKIGSMSSLPLNSSGSGVGNSINDFAGGNYKEQDAYAISAAWKIDKNWVLKGQYAHSETTPINNALGDTSADNWLLGVDYKFTDASKVFVYYGQIDTDGDLTATIDEDLSDKTYAVGYELKF